MPLAHPPDDCIGVHEHIYNAILQVVDDLRGKKILDCGAGYQDKMKWAGVTGASPVWFLRDLFDDGESNYESVDIRPACGCTYTGDIEKLSTIVDIRSYDVVFCFETLEHVLTPGKALAQMRSVLKDDGIIFISVPFTMGHHTPRDLWRWTEDGMRLLLLRNGFKPIKQMPLGGEAGRVWSWMTIAQRSEADNEVVSAVARFDRV